MGKGLQYVYGGVYRGSSRSVTPLHPKMSREVWMVDYGAGNVRSLVNAVARLGFTVRIVRTADDIRRAEVRWAHSSAARG